MHIIKVVLVSKPACNNAIMMKYGFRCTKLITHTQLKLNYFYLCAEAKACCNFVWLKLCNI